MNPSHPPSPTDLTPYDLLIVIITNEQDGDRPIGQLRITLLTISQIRSLQLHLQTRRTPTNTQETVSGFISLLSKSGSSYKMDVESVLISATGTASVQNRQNKLEVD